MLHLAHNYGHINVVLSELAQFCFVIKLLFFSYKNKL